MSSVSISHCPLFSSLNPDECRIVSEMMTVCCFAEDEPIIKEGSKHRACIYSLSESVELPSIF
ncbi:MAG: hypothetical protein R3C11_26255 [Planctomycetaceae bacterium]